MKKEESLKIIETASDSKTMDSEERAKILYFKGKDPFSSPQSILGSLRESILRGLLEGPYYEGGKGEGLEIPLKLRYENTWINKKARIHPPENLVSWIH